MSPEPTSEMNSNIVKRVRNYLFLFLIITLLNIWGDEIFTLIVESITTKDEAELTNLIINSIIAIVTFLVIFILGLGRDLDLHNAIDRVLFKVRRNTDLIIIKEMTNAAQIVSPAKIESFKQNEKEIKYLFYHFINKQAELKALAFTYWENYFVNLYIGIFSLLFFIITAIFSIIRWEIDIFALFPLVFLLILMVIYFSTKNSLIKKIYDIPIQQIREILSSQPSEFETQINNRF